MEGAARSAAPRKLCSVSTCDACYEELAIMKWINRISLVPAALGLALLVGCEGETPAPVTDAVQDVQNAGTAAIDKTKEAGAAAIDATRDAGAKAADAVEHAGEKAADAVKQAGEKAADAVEATGEKAAEAAGDLKEGAEKALEAVK
jgi:hypothetical protein